MFDIVNHSLVANAAVTANSEQDVTSQQASSSRCGRYSTLEADQATGGTRLTWSKTTAMVSTLAISGLSSYPSSPFSSSFPPCGIDGASELPQLERSHHRQNMPSIRKRKRRSNLHAEIEDVAENIPHTPRNPKPRQPLRKRPVSCSPPSSTLSDAFSSLDRHTPWRSPAPQAQIAFQTTLDPQSLTEQERHYRVRDQSRDPFRSVSDSIPSRRSRNHLANNGHGVLTPHHTPSFLHSREINGTTDSTPGERHTRYVSVDGIWSIGGRLAAIPSQLHGVDTGSGEILTSGTNAPMVTAQFLQRPTEDGKTKSHQRRLALALEIDPARRILPISPPKSPTLGLPADRTGNFGWTDNAWNTGRGSPCRLSSLFQRKQAIEKDIPAVAFRVLDAPRLKDDFYCSILAYSHTHRTLAVALTHRVYLWTEQHGVRYPPLPPSRPANYVSSLAFSSNGGGKAILAVARNSGHVLLWSLSEKRPRFEIPHPWAACCVAFRPTATVRQIADQSESEECEDLIVGDDSGCVYYYSVYWPEYAPGQVVLLTKLDAHSQNVCGLAWSPDGRTFVTGGNDNSALLFEVETVLKDTSTVKNPQIRQEMDESISAIQRKSDVSPSILTPPQSPQSAAFELDRPNPSNEDHTVDTPTNLTGDIGRGRHLGPTESARGQSDSSNMPEIRSSESKLQNYLASPAINGKPFMHKKAFYHSAAVKAIAYAPWQPTLLATGGGSNDRQIHFHHTESGSTLAVINVFAQVTSLTWSSTKREIAATFGYAQPEHDIRIAVFAWPSCECVVNIPWERKPNGEIGRALWAIPYPGGPNDASVEGKDEAEGSYQA